MNAKTYTAVFGNVTYESKVTTVPGAVIEAARFSGRPAGRPARFTADPEGLARQIGDELKADGYQEVQP